MEVSGEVADLMVKEGLQVSETAVKLAGSGIKNVAALLLALSRADYKTVGSTSVSRLTKDQSPTIVVPLKKEDMQRFKSMAKQYGASICHERGFDEMHINVPSFGRTCLANANIPFAIGIVENAFHQTHTIAAIPNECVEAEEPELLLLAKKLMATIPFEKMDILMLEQIGKEISGDGMDPNVVGRGYDFRDKPWLTRIGVLGLSPKTGGNFNGIGNADATTRRMFEQGDFEETHPNAITSITTEYQRIPMVMDSDKLCLQLCIRTCPDKGEPLKVMWTKDTLHMGEFYVSTSLKDEIEANPALSTDGKVYEIEWDADDNYIGFKEA